MGLTKVYNLYKNSPTITENAKWEIVCWRNFHRCFQNMKVNEILWLLYESHRVQWNSLNIHYLCSTSHSMNSTLNSIRKKADGCNVLKSSIYSWSPSVVVQGLNSCSRLPLTDQNWNQQKPSALESPWSILSKCRHFANSSDDECCVAGPVQAHELLRSAAGHHGLPPLQPNSSKANSLYSQSFSSYLKA